MLSELLYTVTPRVLHLIQQVDLYIASNEALAFERSEVETLRKALAIKQGHRAIIKKENIALKKKYCDLDEKHKELELQYNILWDNNSHPSKEGHVYSLH
jgi:hypothetical protein